MTPLPWPIPGRCGACLHRAEQYPSGNWRHTETRSCAQRNTTLWRPGGMPLPSAVFVADGDELPQPDQRRYQPVFEYDAGGDFPARIGLHSPRQVGDYWDRVREWLHDQTAQEAS